MKIEEYQKFTPTTALYSKENEFNYLKLGLKSEAGELVGKIAKLYRGDKTFEDMRPGIISELGDICWFVSQFNGRTKTFQFKPDQKSFEWAEHMKSQGGFSTLAHTADTIFDITRDIFIEGNWSKFGDPKPLECEQIRQTTAHLNSEMINMSILLDTTLEDCFDENYEKLTGRAVRGTLKGEGDIR